MSVHPYRQRIAPHERADVPPLLCLVVEGHYVHCGQPMQAPGVDSRGLAVAYTDCEPQDLIDASPETHVLRCACGFQIEAR